MNIDSYGLIVQNNGDGGDSLADSSRYCFARHLNGNPNDQMVGNMCKHLVIYPGTLIRTPTFWDDVADVSRDQQLPFTACLTIYSSRLTGSLAILTKLFKRHEMRGWRYQNLDWASAHHRNVYKPLAREKSGDVLLFIEAFLRVLDSWFYLDSSCGRDLNYQVMLMQISYYNAHSKWTRAAVKVYKWRRKGPEHAVRRYYRENNPEVGEEICNAIKKHL